MTILTHALVGASLAANQNSFAGGFLVGFLSHFIFDVIPHNDYIYFFFRFDKRKRIHTSYISLLVLAVTIATITYFYITSGNPRIIIGALGAVLPDFISTFSGKWIDQPTAFDRFHGFLHSRSSLAEIFLERMSRLKIKRAETPEGGFNNYKTIAATFWGKAGWSVEILIEVAIIGFLLKTAFPATAA